MHEWEYFIEHLLDKYGLPVAVAVWMFWRDYKCLTLLSNKLQIVIDLLGALCAQHEVK